VVTERHGNGLWAEYLYDLLDRPASIVYRTEVICFQQFTDLISAAHPPQSPHDHRDPQPRPLHPSQPGSEEDPAGKTAAVVLGIPHLEPLHRYISRCRIS
jgi:hypothetical protein